MAVDTAAVATLTEFLALLDEWEPLFGKDDYERVLFAASGSRPKAKPRLDELRTLMPRKVAIVERLVGAAVGGVPLVEMHGRRFPAFQAIFQIPDSIPIVRDLLNRAIGTYESEIVPTPPAAPQTPSIAPPVVLDLSFVTDAPLREILERNAKELGIVLAAEAWTAAIVLAGAIAEGVLYFALSTRETRARASAAAVEADLTRNPTGRGRLDSRPSTWLA